MDLINTAYQTAEEAKHACIKSIIASLLSYKDKPILFFYSGGSNREVITAILNEILTLDTVINCTLAAVDERFDSDHSNYIELQKHIGEKQRALESHGIHIIDTSPSLENQFLMADWYDNLIKETIATMKQQDGIIITLLGMGEDGHIAGMLPYPENKQLFEERFLHTEHVAVGYDATGKHIYTKRFTLTSKALAYSDHIYVFAAGKKKLDVLSEAIQQQLPRYQRPITLLLSLPSPYTLFLSRD
jgi:6-phosphogluconolactonase/glucosamine-6-phosphate isomerase/deaminase